MKLSTFLSSLIEEIDFLYNRVSLTLLHRRMTGYHNHISFESSPHAKDIKSPILDCIDHVAVHHKGVKVIVASNEIGSPILGAGEAKRPVVAAEKNGSSNPYMLDKKTVGELSKYFRERKKGVEIQPAIKVKLKRSVWEHINAAMTCARRGDHDNAKMHADIASCAFKEVAHYVPETEYMRFTEKVNLRLEEIKSYSQK